MVSPLEAHMIEGCGGEKSEKQCRGTKRKGPGVDIESRVMSLSPNLTYPEEYFTSPLVDTKQINLTFHLNSHIPSLVSLILTYLPKPHLISK